jgi:DNA polymerase I-like protein with 3'-5' exonuclease and polymerase domains
VAPTEPLSYVIQGTAGWVAAKAMVRCHEQLQKWETADGKPYWINLYVHDELVFDFPRAPLDPRTGVSRNLSKIRKIAALMRQSGDDIGIPLTVSVEYHPDNWGEGIKVNV